jgi:tRNA pseudouridine55 synthase
MKSGVLNIYKPQGMTSHDVVALVRKALYTKKVGHTGTLDPMATGVLPICINRATKIVDDLQRDKKTYLCECTLGIETDTEDIWGKVLNTSEVDLSDEIIRSTSLGFQGDIYQIPPMYSALKVNGKKLYELARAGKVIEREPRLRTIYKIEILDIQSPKFTFLVTCSKGTYIRTLCTDIGKKLGVGACMSGLERVSTGNFHKENSLTVDEVKASGKKLWDGLIPVEDALDVELSIQISEKACTLIRNGVKIDLAHYVKGPLKENDYVLVYHMEKFIALAEYSENKLIVKTLFEIMRS